MTEIRWPGALSDEAVVATSLERDVSRIVTNALDEDLGGSPGQDVTTMGVLSRDAVITAEVTARQPGTAAGLVVLPEILDQVARRFDLPRIQCDFHRRDGEQITRGDVLAVLTGPAWGLLIAERTLLNLLSRASGVATATRVWADELVGTRAQVLDTRKTMPGLRTWDKYAVRCGGGTNKRLGLYDVAMIKDNHIAAAGGVEAAIDAVRTGFPNVTIQVEADTAEQAIAAVQSGARFLLLDNMSDDELIRAVSAVRELESLVGPVELEATGNLTLDRARSVAATGVDYMSVGGLTHSAVSLDIGLDLY